MMVFDETSMYIASGDTNSILRYDLKTKRYLGAFVPPGSGGLVRPIGLEYGPDGNLYATSSGTNSILRYDGKTGKFIDVFVPPGLGGLEIPLAVRFGGPNSDLYVVSNARNLVLQFDRATGKFIRIAADANAQGVSNARGLEFTPRPKFLVYSHVLGDHDARERASDFRRIYIEHNVIDYSDPRPKVALASIVSSDPHVDISKAVRRAHIGQPDFEFDLDFRNNTGAEQKYTITYIAKNAHGLSKIATTTVKVPPRDKFGWRK
jgi:WD40 repeat protein